MQLVGAGDGVVLMLLVSGWLMKQGTLFTFAHQVKRWERRLVSLGGVEVYQWVSGVSILHVVVGVVW